MSYDHGGGSSRSNYHNNNRGHHGGRGGGDRRDQSGNRNVQFGENRESLKVTRNYDNDHRRNGWRGGGGNGGGGRGRYRDNRAGGSGGRGRGDGSQQQQKKLPGNMVQRKEEPVEVQVKLAQEIMTRLGDFSAMTEQDDLLSNIKALANIFVSVGDLREYPEEISDLFVNCFSQLSVQTPILATLLALIHNYAVEAQTQQGAARGTADVDDDDTMMGDGGTMNFTRLVVSKIQRRYCEALAADDVLVAKLLLRALACLSNCGVFVLSCTAGDAAEEAAEREEKEEGEGDEEMEAGEGGNNGDEEDEEEEEGVAGMKPPCGLVTIMSKLLNVVTTDLNKQQQYQLGLSDAASASAYLFASTMVWAAPALSTAAAATATTATTTPVATQQSQALLERGRAVLLRLLQGADQWRSPFAVGGLQAVFHSYSPPEEEEDDDNSGGQTNHISICPGAAAAATAGVGAAAACWDTLLEACHAALLAMDTAAASASGGGGDDVSNSLLATSMNSLWDSLRKPAATTTATAGDGGGGDDEMDQEEEEDEGGAPNAASQRLNPAMPEGVCLSFDAAFRKAIARVLPLTSLKKRPRGTATTTGTTMTLGGKAATCCSSSSSSSSAAGAGAAASKTPTATAGVLGSYASSCWLRARFPVFDADSSADAATCVRSLSPLQKYLALTYLEDILYFFDPVINEDGTKLGSLDLLMAHLLAVGKMFPENSHLEYVLVELLMQIIVQQPSNTALEASACRLLLDLCRKYPQQFPPVVALAANAVFQLVPDLDAYASRAFGRWFAFHLVNTKLEWPAHYWEFWVSEVQEQQQQQQQQGGSGGSGGGALSLYSLFIQFVVEKCSFAAGVASKLQAALPPAFHAFIASHSMNSKEGKAKCFLFPDASSSSSSTHMLTGGAPEPEEVDAAEAQALADAAAASLLPPSTAAGGGGLLVSLAGQLRSQVDQKADPEDLLEWLEQQQEPPAEALGGGGGGGGDAVAAGWRACVLLQTIVKVGSASTALSALVGLLDRYSEALCALAPNDLEQQGLLMMLQELYGGHNAYMFAYLLDEMTRRGQLSVVVVAQYLCDLLLTSGTGGGTGSGTGGAWVLQSVEQLVDRTVGFVRAAVAQRAQFGGNMVLDASLDLTPAPEPETVAEAAEGGGGGGGGGGGAMVTSTSSSSTSRRKRSEEEEDAGRGEDAENDEEEDEDEDDEARSSRRKRMRREGEDEETAAGMGGDDGAAMNSSSAADSAAMAAAAASNDEDMQQQQQQDDDDERDADPLWAAEESVKAAVKNSRQVYAALLSTLTRGIAAAAGGGGGASGAADWTVVAASVLRHTLLVFHGTERQLSSELQQPNVLLTMPTAEMELLLKSVQLPPNLATSTWIAAILNK